MIASSSPLLQSSILLLTLTFHNFVICKLYAIENEKLCRTLNLNVSNPLVIFHFFFLYHFSKTINFCLAWIIFLLLKKIQGKILNQLHLFNKAHSFICSFIAIYKNLAPQKSTRLVLILIITIKPLYPNPKKVFLILGFCIFS
jgi:hypothetical protein